MGFNMKAPVSSNTFLAKIYLAYLIQTILEQGQKHFENARPVIYQKNREGGNRIVPNLWNVVGQKKVEWKASTIQMP